MFRGKPPTLLVVLMVVAAMAVPAGAATTSNAMASEFQVDVQQAQATGDATITVTRNGTAVEGATVLVSGGSYTGNGTYATGENGTVTLPNPDAPVGITIDVYDTEQSASKSMTLVPRSDSLDIDVTQDGDGNATATVTQYGASVENATVNVSGAAYAGNGSYMTDENGTVWLPAPEQTVSVNATAAYDNLTADTTVVLHPNDLTLEVTQASDGETMIIITRNGSAVKNATVDVSGDAYAGNGTYVTNENGTASLPAPEQPVDVTITAAEGADVVSESVHLLAHNLQIDLTQNDDRTATVTVTRNGSAIENATVNVSSDESYAGNGTYATDSNGTVYLPAPENDVQLSVTAAHDGDTASVQGTLAGPEEPSGDLGVGVSQGAERVVIAVTDIGVRQNATVTISGNSSLAGTYATGPDGFLILDAPGNEATVTVDVATNDATGDRSVDIVASNERGPEHTPFGKYVSAYVDSLHHDAELTGAYGHYVSDFVHDFKETLSQSGNGNGNGNSNGNANGNGNGNNPGNGPDHGNGNNPGNGPDHGNGNNPGNGKA